MAIQRAEPVEGLDGSSGADREPEGTGAPQVKGRPAHDVFVSYSNSNKPVADAIVARLEQEGVRCWVAPRDVVPGQNYAEAILQAIETSRLMVVVLSNEANQSQHVPREVERAVHHNVVVVPFRIESVEPSGAMAYFLASEHWLDALTPPLEKHIGQLAEVVNNLLERTPLPSPARTPAPQRRIRIPRFRRRWLIIGAVVLLLAAAGGVFAVLSGGTTKHEPPLPVLRSGPVPSGAVAYFTGDKDARTVDFTVTSPWKLTWTVDSVLDIAPLVYIDTAAGDTVDSIDTDVSGSGSKVESHGGNLHLTIHVYGATNYTFTVANGG